MEPKERWKDLLGTGVSTSGLLLGALVGLLVQTIVAGSGEGKYGYFSQNSNSLVVLNDTLWNVRTSGQQTEFSFRTCSNGELLFQQGTGGDLLKLLIINGTLEFHWIIGQNTDRSYIGTSLNDNQWYTVTSHFYLGKLYLNVTKAGKVKFSEEISNSTHRTYFQSIDLMGNSGLTVGRNFTGCLMQGPNVIFLNNNFITWNNIEWSNSSCARSDNSCVVATPDIQDCYSHPCMHGGTCIDGLYNYTCDCAHMYNGTNCENDLSLYGCNVTACLNGGTCITVSGAASGEKNYRCECVNGFNGEHCENDINECGPNPCLNDGQCIDLIGAFQCNCTGTGYHNALCNEDIDECQDPGVCNGGTCFNNEGGFSCSCQAGFFGRHCEEIDECISDPCQHNGTCEDLVNDYNCTCAPGYEGRECEHNIDDCEGVTCPGNFTKCYDELNSHRCACMAGYEVSGSGPDCIEINECLTYPCIHGTCQDEINHYTCNCEPGYTDNNCQTEINECQPDPCVHGQCTDFLNAYTCSCDAGYTGQNCGENINECALTKLTTEPCKNGGFCVDGVDGYSCDCAAGYTGAICETDINECEPNPCIHSPPNGCSNLVANFSCSCLPGYTGHRCDIDIDDCASDPCKNNGTCTDLVNGYNCTCTDEWMGEICVIQYDACTPELQNCKNNATCTTTPPSRDFHCECVPGFSGSDCGQNIDDCAQHNCSYPERCYDVINGFYCACPIGYTGSDCQTEINECASSPCQNNATCNDEIGHYTCTCKQKREQVPDDTGRTFLTGYTGDNCEIDINECDVIPTICLNVAYCANLNGTFKCYCGSDTSGNYFTGSHCEVVSSYCTLSDVAREDPPACHNGGTCYGLDKNFTCSCPLGFTDWRCKTNIDECESNPCQYNGTCIDGIASYNCSCIPGIEGDNCETNIDDCNPHPCGLGQCIDLINDYECNCTDTGFKGENCSVNIDDCESTPCFHNATCEDKIKDFSCQCYPGYDGKQCQIDIDECAAVPCQYNGTCHQRSLEIYYLNGTEGFDNLTYSYATAAGYVCNCIDGITGESCEINIDDCNHDNCNNGTCIDGINKYTCDCHPGYRGTFCNIEIDECQLYQACKNGATCKDLIADYSCSCLVAGANQQQYAGKNCTFLLTSCESNLCENGATCKPYLIDEATAQQDYKCLCTSGFTGRYCNVSTTMSFDTGSYIQQSLIDPSNVSLSFRFRTTLKNSILLSWTGSHDTGLFLTFELVDGVLVLQFYDLFASVGGEVRNITGVPAFNDGHWHQVDLTKTSHLKVKVTSNNCLPSFPSLCEFDTNYLDYSNDSGNAEISFGMTTDTMSLNHTMSLTPFVGCMEDVTVMGNKLVLAANLPNFLHVSDGCPRKEQCVPDPCNSRGACIDLWNKYQCDCRRPYLGLSCETGYVAATFGYNYQDSTASFSLPPSLQTNLMYHFDLSFFFRTRQLDGLMIFFGDINSNFVSLELDQGRLGIRSRFCGIEFYKVTNRDTYANGEQYFIQLVRNRDNNDFKFTIDDSSQFTETIPSNCDFQANTLMFGGITQSSPGRRRRETINVPGKDLTDFTGTTAFKGTIQDARVNGVSLEFYPLNDQRLSNLPVVSVTAQSGLEEGEKTSEVCDIITPCENNATCSDVFFDDYRCDCTLGYRGKNCSELDFCVVGTCPDGSTCQSLLDGFECISSATFNGKDSFAIYGHTLSSNSDIRTFSFKIRTLSQNGWIMHIEDGNQYYKARLTGSHVVIWYKLGSSPVRKLEAPLDASDSKWYLAVVTETDTSLTLTLNEEEDEAVTVSVSGTKVSGTQLTSLVMNAASEIAVGNVGTYNQRDPYMHGCLKEVRIGQILLPFFSDESFINNTSSERFLLNTERKLSTGCKAGELCENYSQCKYGECIDDFYDYQCNCSAGYSGRWCEERTDYCTVDSCANGQCVSSVDTYHCRCPSGYSGDRCETDVNECATPDQCQNNGSCQDFNGTYNCTCTELFAGYNCEVSLNNTCGDNPCDHGQCSSINITLSNTGEEIESFKCSCDQGYEGYACDQLVDHCSDFPCDNGGNCTSDLVSYTCSCPTGYTGDTCSDNIDDCTPGVCQNGGQCVDLLNTYVCNCTEYWMGVFCTVDIDECKRNQPCQNTGLCRNHNNGYTCNCAGTGFEGQDCEKDVDECLDSNTCLNGATCNNTVGSFDCNCTKGYEGVNCQTPNCSDVPCQYSSTCTEINNGAQWKCVCLNEYYEGDYCEQKGPCAFDPCYAVNTQSCSQNISENTYICNCKSGWKGENCTEDVDECENSPCKNNATCENTIGSYKCKCDTGYEGQLCGVITDNCSPSPCKNGGDCINYIGYFECNCTSTGYTNETCIVDVDECEEFQPCLHNGVCSNNVGSYHCECPEGYEGQDCEVRVDSLMDQDITWYIVGPCLAVVLILIVIVIVWVMLCLRKKRATRGAYSPSRQEVTGSRVELDNVLKKPPLERLI